MATILIIDDEEYVREVVTQIVMKDGHEAIKANDGKEGVCKYLEKPADLVITDILMPEQEGLETILALRGINPAVKIIAISGGGSFDQMHILETAQKLGAYKILPKPFEVDDLRAMVSDCLTDPQRDDHATEPPRSGISI